MITINAVGIIFAAIKDNKDFIASKVILLFILSHIFFINSFGSTRLLIVDINRAILVTAPPTNLNGIDKTPNPLFATLPIILAPPTTLFPTPVLLSKLAAPLPTSLTPFLAALVTTFFAVLTA